MIKLNLMIQVQNLTKQYPNTLAIDNISFEVAAGEIVGFLGPNAAGKTTTIRIITCLLPPTSGNVLVGGYDIYEHPLEVKRQIGYLPETNPLYHEMRVKEYLSFRARIKKIPRKQQKKAIFEAVEQCGIKEVYTKIIGQLSKGYRQRLGLADALLGRPKILILDEPTLGLDPNQIREVRALIKELGKQHTILLSTHILPEVEMICQKVVIIHKGKIRAKDTPEALKERLKGEKILETEIRGPSPQILTALKKIQGVNKIEKTKTENGITKVRLTTSPQKDIREEIFMCVVQNGWKLRELSCVTTSLEDVFTSLTKEEKEKDE